MAIASDPSNDGSNVTFAVYMPTYNASSTLRLSRAASPANIWGNVQCDRINTAAVSTGTTAIEVRMSGAGLTAVTYSIPNATDLCTQSLGTTNLRASPSNARFWANYQLPAGAAVLDAETGMYKVNVTVRYTSAVTTQVAAGNGSASMVFRATLQGAPAGSFLGTVGSTGSVNALGIGSRTFAKDSDNEYYRHYFDFGVPCSQTSPQTRSITIRDPDNYNSSGGIASTQGSSERGALNARPLGMYVIENGSALAQSRYTVPATQGTVSLRAGVYMVTPTTLQNGSGQSGNTTFSFTMHPGRTYQLAVFDVYYRNILQIQLPTDASYNAITCPTADFELQPSLNDLVDSIVPGETSVGPIEARVDNTGADPTPTATLAGIARYVYRGSGSLATSGDTVGGITTAANYSCRIVEAENLETPPPQECVALWEGSAAAGISGDTLLHSIADFNPSSISPALQVGDQVCFIAVVNRYNESQGDTDWRYSDPVCIKVAKVPFVHIEGHDIRVGSSWDITGNQNSSVGGMSVSSGGNIFGSRGEYAIFAPGTVAGLSSGYSTAANTADRNRLTFSNSSGYGSFAGLAGMGVIPDVANYFFEGGVPTPANVRADIAASGVNYSNIGGGGQLNLNPSTTPVSGTRVYYRNGPITIRETARDELVVNQPSDPGAISQVIIIANGDINIEQGVQRLDAWLVSLGGTVNTCSDGPVNLSTSNCSNLLTINGLVMADRLVLRRTAGANNTAQLNNPAERINLPASTFLWGHQMEQTNGSLQTTYTRELPPRF